MYVVFLPQTSIVNLTLAPPVGCHLKLDPQRDLVPSDVPPKVQFFMQFLCFGVENEITFKLLFPVKK